MTTKDLRHPYIWVPDADTPTWVVRELTPDMIDTTSIVKGLSKECRFARQIEDFYSVAQHSVLLAVYADRYDLCPKEQLIYFLLHDAAEAYLGDMAKPIKLELPDFQALEDDVLKVIFERFELDWPMPDIVHELDTRILIDEASQLFADVPGWVEQYIQAGWHPLNVDVKPWPWQVAAATYRVMFQKYYNLHIIQKRGAFL